MNDQEKSPDEKVRWQKTRIDQLSHVNYLILTFSLAALGFAVSLLPDDKFDRVVGSLHSYRLSLLLFVLSIGLGIWCAINRLRDFRSTARRARLEYEGGNQCEVESLRFFTKKLGEWSWGILWCQIGFFGAGILFFMLAIAGRLF